MCRTKFFRMENDEDLAIRLAVVEARLADLERGPAPRIAGHEGTYHRLMSDELYQAALTDEPTTDERINAAIWATQVIARDLDGLLATVEEALNSPGGRSNPN